MKHRLIAIVCLLGAIATAAAQTSPMTVLTNPTPNQTLRVRTTEVVDTTIEAEPADPPMRGLERRETHVTVNLEFTSTVGPADDRGRYDARVICDRAAVTAMINGSPVPTSDLQAQIAGRAFTIRYGEHNEFRTLLAEGDEGSQIRAVMDSVSHALIIAMPPAVSVGETVTVRGALALARPMTYGNTDADFRPSGNTRYTLNAITFDGADRVAHLTMKSSGTTTLPPGPPTPGFGRPAALTVKVSGEGTSEVNIDRGIVLRHEQHVTTESVRQVEGSSLAPGRTTSTTTLIVERIQ